MQTVEKRRLVSVALASSATAWALALVAGPWLATTSDALAGVLYATASLVCHQRPERSFHVGAAQLPVCARCLGLYGGAALGLIGWTVASHWRGEPWNRVSALTSVVTAGLPTGLTVATAWLGVADPSNLWRGVLAVPLGVAGGLVVGAVGTGHLK